MGLLKKPVLEIRPCTVAEIVGDPHFTALRREYSAESAVAGLPDPQEKLEMYQAIERTGALQAFGAFVDGALAGFVTVLAPVLPHYGIAIAVTESLFVAAAHRRTGAGLLLLRTAERHAEEIGSPGLLVSAPRRGRLETLLPRIGYDETNRVFLKRFRHA